MTYNKTYTLNNWRESITDFFKPLSDFLKKEKFYTSDLDRYERSLNERHSEWVIQNKIIVFELNDLIENDPRKSFEIIKSGLLEVEMMYSLKRHQIFNNGEIPSPGKQIEELAGAFEHLNQLKFISYLLSQRRCDIKTLTKQSQILKHFKCLGISSSEISLFRSLRNVSNHKALFRNNKCTLEDGREISIEEIEILYKKIKSYFDYFKNIILCSLLNIPKFTLYLFLIYYNNKEEFEAKNANLGESFRAFYPELIKEKEPFDEVSLNRGVFAKFVQFTKKVKSKLNPVQKDKQIIDSPQSQEKLITLCKFIAQSKVEISKVLKILLSEHDKNNLHNLDEINDEYIRYILKIETPLDLIFEQIKSELLNKKKNVI